MIGTPRGQLLSAALDDKTSTVTLSDIEDRLRSLTGGAKEALAESKQSALAVGGLFGVGLVAAVYFLGRRRGRRRATILEVVRV